MPNGSPSSDRFPKVFFSVMGDGKVLEDLINNQDYRNRLSEILSDEEQSTSERIQSILRLGAEWFGVENGHLVRIDPAQGTHTIAEVSDPHPGISREDVSDLSSTYCRKVIAQNAPLAVDNAPRQGWGEDPAYEGYKLSTYLGAKVVVSGKLYGTVCFVDREPRARPFGESEAAALALIVRTIGQELERRRHEDRLRQTTARLKALFEESPDMIFIHDTEGRFIVPNPRLCEKTGFEAEELVQMKVWDLDRAVGSEEAKAPWVDMEPGDQRQFEGEYARKNETSFPVEVDLRCLDLEGKDRFIATARDITARKEREKELRLFEQVIKQANDAVLITESHPIDDPGPRIEYVNPAFEEMTGYAQEELKGKTPRLLQGPKTERKVLDSLREALKREEAWSGETINYRKSGEPYYLRWSVAPVRSEDDSVAYWASVQRDVTAEKRRQQELIEAKEKAETAERLKSAMLANMSHEIRTPLTSISGFSEMLKENLEGEPRDFAGKIHESSQRLRRTLESVLHLSKVEAGAHDLEQEELALGPIVEEAVETLRSSAEQKSLTVTTATPSFPVEGYWNENALFRICRNLLENAIKFTPEGGRVDLRLTSDGGDAVLEVEDNGIGMDPSSAEKLFEPFRQESEGLDRDYEGTGLGLSIVRRLTEELGGTLEFESEKGKGSRFTVRLPKVEGTK